MDKIKKETELSYSSMIGDNKNMAKRLTRTRKSKNMISKKPKTFWSFPHGSILSRHIERNQALPRKKLPPILLTTRETKIPVKTHS